MPDEHKTETLKDVEPSSPLVSPPVTKDGEPALTAPASHTLSQPETKVDRTEATHPNAQDNPAMEVHHHGHVHHEKKWKEYIFQFFMLFLAVFCGFLAENQREHYIEGQRIKDYMHGMTDDLRADTFILKSTLASLNNFVARFDSLQPQLQRFDRDENIRAHYYMAALLIGTMDFTATKRTSEQLRNTGYYRLISNKPLLDSLVYYDTRIRKGEDYWQAQRLQERHELLNLQARIFDVGQIRKIRDARQSNRDTKPLFDSLRLITKDQELISEYYNKLVNYRYACFNQAYLHQFLIDKAVHLIGILEKEYN